MNYYNTSLDEVTSLYGPILAAIHCELGPVELVPFPTSMLGHEFQQEEQELPFRRVCSMISWEELKLQFEERIVEIGLKVGNTNQVPIVDLRDPLMLSIFRATLSEGYPLTSLLLQVPTLQLIHGTHHSERMMKLITTVIAHNTITEVCDARAVAMCSPEIEVSEVLDSRICLGRNREGAIGAFKYWLLRNSIFSYTRVDGAISEVEFQSLVLLSKMSKLQWNSENIRVIFSSLLLLPHFERCNELGYSGVPPLPNVALMLRYSKHMLHEGPLQRERKEMAFRLDDERWKLGISSKSLEDNLQVVSGGWLKLIDVTRTRVEGVLIAATAAYLRQNVCNKVQKYFDLLYPCCYTTAVRPQREAIPQNVKMCTFATPFSATVAAGVPRECERRETSEMWPGLHIINNLECDMDFARYLKPTSAMRGESTLLQGCSPPPPEYCTISNLCNHGSTVNYSYRGKCGIHVELSCDVVEVNHTKGMCDGKYYRCMECPTSSEIGKRYEAEVEVVPGVQVELSISVSTVEEARVPVKKHYTRIISLWPRARLIELQWEPTSENQAELGLYCWVITSEMQDYAHGFRWVEIRANTDPRSRWTPSLRFWRESREQYYAECSAMESVLSCSVNLKDGIFAVPEGDPVLELELAHKRGYRIRMGMDLSQMFDWSTECDFLQRTVAHPCTRPGDILTSPFAQLRNENCRLVEGNCDDEPKFRYIASKSPKRRTNTRVEEMGIMDGKSGMVWWLRYVFGNGGRNAIEFERRYREVKLHLPFRSMEQIVGAVLEKRSDGKTATSWGEEYTTFILDISANGAVTGVHESCRPPRAYSAPEQGEGIPSSNSSTINQ